VEHRAELRALQRRHRDTLLAHEAAAERAALAEARVDASAAREAAARAAQETLLAIDPSERLRETQRQARRRLPREGTSLRHTPQASSGAARPDSASLRGGGRGGRIEGLSAAQVQDWRRSARYKGYTKARPRPPFPLPPILTGHVSSLSPYQLDTSRATRARHASSRRPRPGATEPCRPSLRRGGAAAPPPSSPPRTNRTHRVPHPVRWRGRTPRLQSGSGS